MKRFAMRAVPVVALLVAGIAAVAPRLSGQGTGVPSTKNGEWPMYTADHRGTKYSPLDQVNAANFSKMEVAWRFKTDNLGPRPETKLESTPIMVKGMLYAVAGTRRAVVALDPRTGEQKWMYALDEGERATRWAPRQLSGRGLSYWTDGKGDDRVVYVTTGYQLVSLNAKNGVPVAGFGTGGKVDLKVGVVIGKDKQIDLEKGEVGIHSTPLVVGDTIIVGSAMFEGLGYRYATNSKGVVRAYDARTGKQLWKFNTIPYPGEPGNETWENGSWEWSGNVGVWTEITVDTELNTVYLPVETPTIDEYGGNRPGDNLYAESLVAVDLKTGKKKWHYQFVHHPLWDHDLPCWPLLMDVTIDGKPRKIVAVPTKQGWVYVFDRITGVPIWPINEKPVPQTDMSGEKTAKTQPFPSKPPAFSRTYVAENDIIDFTPELRAQALKNLARFRWEQSPFVPPVGPNSDKLGTINIANTTGGVNWPGSGFDPETGIIYTHAHNSAVTVGKYEEEEFSMINPENFKTKARQPRWEADPSYGLPRAPSPAGAPAAAGFPGTDGRRALAEGLNGLPIVKPPYGLMVALDMNKGDIKWSVPHGDTPDAVRDNPLLKGMTIPKTGQPGNVGVLITKTLVIAGDPQFTSPPGRARGAMLRAYNKETGAQVGEILLPAPVLGQPMTYSLNGKQYIVVGVSGGNYRGEFISLVLPDSERTGTAAARPQP
ncbi:MAG: PQQ-binding-like beta-propeller repeat protein [Acidobacteriota bacterium]